MPGDETMIPEKNREVRVRSNVGVRNPFPLAQAILLREEQIEGDHIDWTEIRVERAKEYLYRAFKVRYEDLFDPGTRKARSPLYRGMPGVEGKKNPGTRQGKEFLFPVRTGAGPCQTSVINSWNTREDWRYPLPPPPPPASGGPYGVDTLQGASADCYFIAALSSVAWTDTTLLPGGWPDTANPPRHKYKLYSAPGKPVGKIVARALALDTGNNLIFAKPADNIHVWASIYEKAYAIFRGIPPLPQPDIGQLCFGNPVTCLTEITGSTADALSLKNSDQAALFQFINERCGNTGSGGRTTRPMVAWTYPDSSGISSGDQYNDDLIVANHSYSILGTTLLRDVPCVVLRNPFGISIAPPKPGIHECPDWLYPIQLSEGNFCMEMGAFIDYFEGIGFLV
jgi:hypothetical protein